MRIRNKLLCLLATASLATQAQNISQIAQSDPLIMTGVVGTRNTYYHSSVGDGYAAPMSNLFYLNLNINYKDFSMPVSFYFTNDNLDFNHPHVSFSLNPRYKNWTGYIGRNSMAFSNYVMNMSLNGVGIEYNDQHSFHFGAFYGVLRNAINDDPNSSSARYPQYKRLGWGVKVGYGNSNNYIDLYFLRAYDRLKSLDDHWQQRLAPQENIVVGLKGSIRPIQWFSLTGNLATSLFTSDMRIEQVKTEQADKWGGIFDTRYSSMARLAGDVSATFTLKNLLNASLVYRVIQPDYTSLGTYYMANNYQSFGVNVSAMPVQNLTLMGTFSAQSDNLTQKQLYTTRGFVYSLMASTRIGQHFNISAGYNGYTQNQGDGAVKVTDSTKVNRVMRSFSLTPSASFYGEEMTHSISLSASLTQNRDRNKKTSGNSDVTSKAVGLGYTMGVMNWDMDFMANLSHQVSSGYKNKYISSIATLGASRSFFKDKGMNVTLNVNFCMNELEKKTKTFSVGGDLSLGYTLNRVHVFSVMAGVNKYNDVNLTLQGKDPDAMDISASLNYTYTFSLFDMGGKAGKRY